MLLHLEDFYKEPKRPLSEIADKIAQILINNLNENTRKEGEELAREQQPKDLEE